MIVSVSDILLEAKKSHFAIGAFNVSTFEQIKAIFEAAALEQSPIIIETSESEANYLGYEIFSRVVREMGESLPTSVAINFDHGKSLESITRAIKAGYTGVHIDGSEMPLNTNIDLAKEIVQLAHEKNISVEGEFTHIGGSSEVHSNENAQALMTDPEEAMDFIRQTGVDIFAGGYGNIHGIYAVEPKLDTERIKMIASSTDVFLSLHGGSGIPDDEIKKAIEVGITKINVNTELRVAYREGLERSLAQNQKEVVPYKILPGVIDSVREVARKKIRVFRLQ